MVISSNSQLGLRFKDDNIKLDFLNLMKEYIEKELGLTQSVITKLCDIANERWDKDIPMTNADLTEEEKQFVNHDVLSANLEIKKIRDKITDCIGERDMLRDDDTSYFFICESVYKCAELIKIKEAFSGRTLKDIKIGKYTYLMGKHRMVRFLVGINAIKGWYYDCEKRIVFEWGIEMENGEYYFSHDCSEEFTMLMRVLTFVELGDIEIQELQGGKNNGLSKKEGKITNTDPNTIFVVDSSWNKLTIRTDGFAVRGHFRLQPCGDNMKDRKLIWIDAFEKHGYKRQPKAKILHNG